MPIVFVADLTVQICYKSLTVKDVRCEEQEKAWTVVPFHKKGRGNCVLVLSSHDRIGRRYKRMKRAGKGKFCRGEGGFLLLRRSLRVCS